MKIGNKIKQFLCGESYGKSSYRKSLGIPKNKYEELEKYKNTIGNKRNRKWKTYDIGQIVEVNGFRICDGRKLLDKIYNDKHFFGGWGLKFNVKIIEKWENKIGREEYKAEILSISGDKYSTQGGYNPDRVIGEIVKIQAVK